MRSDQERSGARRRDLLKLAGLGGISAVATVATVARPAEAKEEPGSKAAGYRETEHVRKAYELARF